MDVAGEVGLNVSKHLIKEAIDVMKARVDEFSEYMSDNGKDMDEFIEDLYKVYIYRGLNAAE